jgi:hypothetical protein
MSGPKYNEQLQRIVAKYREAGEPWPATARQIAGWGISRGLWAPHRDSVVKQFAEQLARAMREEYIVDSQGRTVRAKHAARITENGEQLVLWADIRSAPLEHMEIAFQQRRHQIVGDCRQLKIDVDSYNENTNATRPIQMVFDFTDDLLELEVVGTL